MIRGIRVIGKLLSPEQSAELANRQSAQFIVKGMVNGELQLKLLGELQSTPITTQESQWITLSKNLLHIIKMPVDDENVMLAKALLKNNLPVTQKLMEQMKTALQSLGQWGEAEAEMAAALKSGGFPISNGSLALALQKLPDFNSNVQDLQMAIRQQIQKESSPEVRQLLESGLKFLENLRIDLSAPPEQMAEQIKNIITVFGKSIEANIAGMVDSSNLNAMIDDEGNLNLLLNLRNHFLNRNESAAVKLLDTMINSMRQMQFLNTAQMTDPLDPPWLTVNLPINAGALQESQQKNQNNFTPANIKISYQSGQKDKKISAQDTRLILSFELDHSSKIKIDISMLGKKMGAWMTVNSEKWKSLVDDESLSFKAAMERLGYELQFTKCNVSHDISMLDMSTTDNSIPVVERVNIEA
ncbi:MAG: hypothetical protein JEZ00_00785 [Anaerolineaceae bacterium]|nr:hypothetical protein [Anaerolineaceae bacterium]